ncbi:hypothetical protein C8R44DRAFT_982663 [Mycena epipterygia]|nr:hypothetical protein C8R44DRAFT_982663 [Mycena epipterygia]
MTLITHHPAAKKALASKLGPDRRVTMDDIVEFLTNRTPAIVFKALRNERNGDAIVWGKVARGDAQGAEDNELFLSLELTEALRDDPPPHISQDEVPIQRRRQTLLWSIVLLHELVQVFLDSGRRDALRWPPSPRREWAWRARLVFPRKLLDIPRGGGLEECGFQPPHRSHVEDLASPRRSPGIIMPFDIRR